MKINTRDMAATGNAEILDQNEFGISRDPDDEDFAMDVMSSQLYSDSLKIICQEYMSNARDAHRDAGRANIPVEIHLPTVEEPYYEVSDYGNGISPKNFKTIFLKYFASTKRKNDDASKRQNGGFGLGAKSAWSYTSEFFVTTVHEGIEYCYHCYRNENKKRVSDLVSQSRVGAGEHDGTKVRVNILPKDILTFHGKFRDITLMWGVKPKVVYPQDFKYATFEANACIYEDDNVVIFNRNCGARNVATALVDDIPYPIDASIFQNILNASEMKFLGHAAAYIRCDKLMVDPTPNRENLEYNQRTKDYLGQKIKDAHAAIYGFVSNKINQASSYWEACCMWSTDETVSSLCNMIETPNYKDTPMLDEDVREIRYDGTYRRGKEKTYVQFVNVSTKVDGSLFMSSVNDVGAHKIKSDIPFVFNIGGNPAKCVDKINTLLATLSKDKANHSTIRGLNLVRLPSETDALASVMTQLEKDYHWSQLLKYNLGDVVVPKVKMERSKGKVKGMVYRLTPGKTLVKEDVDFKGRHDIYIPLKNKTVTIFGKECRYDASPVTEYKAFITCATGMDFTQVNIYAVPMRFIKKLEKVKTMRSFDMVVKDAETAMRQKYDFDAVASKKKNVSHYHDVVGKLSSNIREVYSYVKKNVSADSVIAKACELHTKYYDSKNTALNMSTDEQWILWYISMQQIPVTITSHDKNFNDAKDTIEACVKMYATFLEMFSTYGLRYSKERVDLTADIVNMIERKNNPAV
jgi:hypothetical protein